jgi:hypothetical protein
MGYKGCALNTEYPFLTGRGGGSGPEAELGRTAVINGAVVDGAGDSRVDGRLSPIPPRGKWEPDRWVTCVTVFGGHSTNVSL